MPSRERELRVVVLGDATSAQRALGKLDDSVAKTEATVGRAQSGLAKFGPAIALGATAAAGTLLAVSKRTIDAYGEQRKVEAQTAAAIKSTGGAAGVTAEHVKELAGELGDLAKVQDENVQKGANLLLTFTNVQNRVGEGNDIFDQATRVLLDMSVAMGTDVSSQAIQLGKALNDPLAGVSALAEVGVTFNDQQREQIRLMVESGDVAGAQKVILAELTEEFGGSAEAAGDAATNLDKLRLMVDKLEESVGRWLDDRAGDFFDGLDKLANWKATGALKTFLDGTYAVLDAAADAADRLYGTLKNIIGLVSGADGGEAAKDAGNALIPLGDLVQSVRGIFRNPFRRHEGGLIHSQPHVARPGLAADEVPAVLQRGEYVVRTRAVQAVGVAALDRLNRMGGSSSAVRPGAGGRLAEDSVPYTSPTGARLLDFRWGRAVYADGSAYTSAGWVKARPAGGLRFRPGARLDTSQVEDRRGQTANTWHAGGLVGAIRPVPAPGTVTAIPAASPSAVGGVIDYDRLAQAIAGALPATTQSKRIEFRFGDIHGLRLDDVLREADRRARLAALVGED